MSKLTIKEINKIKKEKKLYENNYAIIIEALKIVQNNRKWIDDSSIKYISKELNVSISSIEEIATFYDKIFRKPVGKNIIYYCDSFVCYIKGYKKIKNKLEKILNIKTGETTKNKNFTLLPTCCLGNCDKSPVIMINKKIFTNINKNNINNILEKYYD